MVGGIPQPIGVMVMELFKGQTVGEFILSKIKSDDPKEVKAIVRKILEKFLDKIFNMHDFEIVHADISPANVMVTIKDDFDVKLIDWGKAEIKGNIDRNRWNYTLTKNLSDIELWNFLLNVDIEGIKHLPDAYNDSDKKIYTDIVSKEINRLFKIN